MKKLSMLFFVLVTMIVSAPSFAGLLIRRDGPLPTVPSVDLGRYIGKWYAVAALPHIYTLLCEGQTAEYQILGPTKISVLNTCVMRNGTTSINGVATVVNTDTNAELEVIFDTFWNRALRVKGDYNIIKISEGYDTVMVASKDRDSLWIMSRTPYMDPAVYKEYVNYAATLGFRVHRLLRSTF